MMRPASLFVAAVLVSAVLGQCVASAQDNPAGAAKAPLTYRRVYVPEADLKSEAHGLLPLNRTEFERRIQAAETKHSQNTIVTRCRIAEAEYHARFEDSQLIDGAASLDVRLDSDDPIWLPLDRCNLAISEATWGEAMPQAAVLGRGSSGQTTLLVEKSERLSLGWSARGRRDAADGWSFDLEFPPASRSELHVVLPDGWELSADKGIVERPAPMTDAPGQWTVRLGGISAVRVGIAPANSNHAEQPLVLVHESARYNFLPGQLAADITLDLDVLQQPVQELVLQIGQPLEIVSIRHGDQRLMWYEQPDSSKNSDERRVVVRLLEPIRGAARTLQIAAVADWPLDAPQTAPRVGVQGGIWQDGKATLQAGADLQLAATPKSGCRQTGVALSATAAQGDAQQFEYFLEDGELSVQASRRDPGLRITSGLSVNVDSTQTNAALVADIATTGGERFDIEAVASRSWVIESVETIPAELLEQQSLDTRGADEQRLRIQLRRPLTEDKTARLIVRARRQKPREGELLPDDFLQLFEFVRTRQRTHLVSLASGDASLEPKLAADSQLVRRNPADATPAELSLFETPPGPIFFEARDNRSQARVVLRRGEPRFSADVEIHCQASRTRLAHEVRITCQPESAAVSALNVRVSPAPASAIAWSLEGDENGIVAAPVAASQLADAKAATLTRLQLQRPRSASFVIVGRWSEPLQGRRAAPLVSLPEAAAQTGVIEVTASEGLPLGFAHDGLSLLPAADVPSDQFSATKARFRYEPGRTAHLSLVPRLAAEVPSAVWVRRQHVVSSFMPGGQAYHVATLEVENHGAELLSLRLSPLARIQEIAIDGQPMPLALPADASGQFTIPLPSGERLPTLRIQYLSTISATTNLWSQTLATVLPQCQAPCLQRSWQVHLAPGLKAWSLTAVPEQAGTAGKRGESRRPINLLSVVDWRRFIESARLIGFTSTDSHDLPALDERPPPGWNSYQLELPEGGRATIDVYRPQVLQALAVALALAAFSVVGWARLRRPRELLITAAAALVVAALVPEAVSWLVAGAAAGLIAAAIWCLGEPLARSTRPLGVTASRRSTQLLTQSASLLLLGLWASGQSLTIAAQEPARAAEGPPAKIQRVVIPIDDEQKPAGDYVYLAPEFYEELHRLSDDAASATESWVIRRADYEVTLASPDADGSLRTGEMVARYEVDTLQDSVSIALPLDQEQIHLVEAGATLDGDPLAVEWTNDGRSLVLNVAEAGGHKLELNFGVALAQRDDAYALKLSIPKVPTSDLQLHLPSARIDCLLPTALGRVLERDEGATLVAELGPTDQIVAHCSVQHEADSVAADVAVDQRLWWRVRPSSVIVEGRFDFNAISGELRRLTIKADPRLRLLPLGSTTGIARQWMEEGATENRLHFELAQPYPTEATLHASFLLAGASGIGNLAPPPLEAVATRTSRSWAALSVADGFQAETDAPTFPADNFRLAWDESAPAPVLAWDAPRTNGQPTFSIRPITRQPTAKEELRFSFEQDIGAVRFRAGLSSVPDAVYQYRLAVPAKMRVRRVVVSEKDVAAEIRWWQDPSGAVIVLLAQAAGPEQTIELQGDLDSPLASQFDLPLVHLQGVETENYEVRLFRRGDVAFQVVQHAGFETAEESLLGDYVADAGRLIGQFTATDPNKPAAGKIRIRLQENDPVLTGRMVTRVQRSAAGWEAVVDCDLTIGNGLLDALRFEVPAEWSGPFEINPAVENTLLTLPGQSRRHLVVRPPRAAAEHIQLTIRSPLTTTSADTVRAPNVELLEAPRVTRYLALTNRGGQGSVNWETSGLQAVTLNDLQQPADTASSYETFQVVAPHYDALVRTVAPANQRAIVRLADVEVAWQHDRRYFGTVRFHVQPTWLTPPDIEVPHGCQLASLLVDGVPADAERQGDRAWRLNLAAHSLPQVIEAIFIGRLPVSTSETLQMEFDVPRLARVPVERTLWTIRGPRAVGPASIASPASEQISLVIQDLDRLETLVREIETVAGVQAATGRDLSPWIARWNRAFQQQSHRLETEFKAHPPNAETESSYRSMLAAAAASLARLDHVVDAEALSSEANSRRSIGSTSSPLRLQSETFGPVTLQYATAKASNAAAPHSWLALALLATLAAGIVQVSRWPAFGDWMHDHGHYLLALAGLTVWLFLPWGWIGWLLVATAVILAVRMPWAPAKPAPTSFSPGR